MQNKKFCTFNPYELQMLGNWKVHFFNKKVYYSKIDDYYHFHRKFQKDQKISSQFLYRFEIDEYNGRKCKAYKIKNMLMNIKRIGFLKFSWEYNQHMEKPNLSEVKRLGHLLKRKMIEKLEIVFYNSFFGLESDLNGALSALIPKRAKFLTLYTKLSSELVPKILKIKSLHFFKVKFKRGFDPKQDFFRKLKSLKNLKYCTIEFKEQHISIPEFIEWINENKINCLRMQVENLDNISKLVQKCPGLHEISIDARALNSDDKLESIYSIQHLRIDQTVLKSDNTIVYSKFLASFKNLHTIDLSYIFSEKSFTQWIGAFKELNELRVMNLKFFGISAVTFEEFSKFCVLVALKNLVEVNMYIAEPDNTWWITSLFKKPQRYVEKFLERSLDIKTLKKFKLDFSYSEATTSLEIFNIISKESLQSIDILMARLNFDEYEEMLKQYTKLPIKKKYFTSRVIIGRMNEKDGMEEIINLAKKFNMNSPGNYRSKGFSLSADTSHHCDGHIYFTK